jgi:hypothetical protein
MALCGSRSGRAGCSSSPTMIHTTTSGTPPLAPPPGNARRTSLSRCERLRLASMLPPRRAWRRPQIWWWWGSQLLLLRPQMLGRLLSSAAAAEKPSPPGSFDRASSPPGSPPPTPLEQHFGRTRRANTLHDASATAVAAVAAAQPGFLTGSTGGTGVWPARRLPALALPKVAASAPDLSLLRQPPVVTTRRSLAGAACSVDGVALSGGRSVNGAVWRVSTGSGSAGELGGSAGA